MHSFIHSFVHSSSHLYINRNVLHTSTRTSSPCHPVSVSLPLLEANKCSEYDDNDEIKPMNTALIVNFLSHGGNASVQIHPTQIKIGEEKLGLNHQKERK